MIPQRPPKLLPRKLGRLLLAVAMLVTAGRVAQLALGARHDSRASAPLWDQRHETPAAPGFAGGSALRQSAAKARVADSTPGEAGGGTAPPTDAELAELYSACPLAAVIDWQTVAQSPERAEALLPPYRETAIHVLNPADDADVPRVRYPVRVEVPDAGIRVAQLPQAKNIVSSGPLLVAETPAKPNSPPPATTNNKFGEWLIDPSEWLTAGNKPSSPAPSQPTPPPPAPPSAVPAVVMPTAPAAPTKSTTPPMAAVEKRDPAVSKPPAAASGLEGEGCTAAPRSQPPAPSPQPSARCRPSGYS